ADAIGAIDKEAAALEGTGGGRFGRGARAAGQPSINRLQGELLELMDVVERADATPTSQAKAAAVEIEKDLNAILAASRLLKEKDVKALNDRLREAGLPILQ